MLVQVSAEDARPPAAEAQQATGRLDPLLDRQEPEGVDRAVRRLASADLAYPIGRGIASAKFAPVLSGKSRAKVAKAVGTGSFLVCS